MCDSDIEDGDRPVQKLSALEERVASIIAQWEREDIDDSLNEISIRLVRLVQGDTAANS